MTHSIVVDKSGWSPPLHAQHHSFTPWTVPLKYVLQRCPSHSSRVCRAGLTAPIIMQTEWICRCTSLSLRRSGASYCESVVKTGLMLGQHHPLQWRDPYCKSFPTTAPLALDSMGYLRVFVTPLIRWTCLQPNHSIMASITGLLTSSKSDEWRT